MRPYIIVSAALSASLLATAAAPAAFAANIYDEMLTIGPGQLAVAPLPDGPASAPEAIDPLVSTIFAMPDGKLLVVAGNPNNGGPQQPTNVLAELRADGTLRQIATLPGNGILPTTVMDMDLDSHGRFYLLMRVYAGIGGQYTVTLMEVDPATGAILSNRTVPEMNAIATAPNGLWVLAGGRLYQLDTNTLALGSAVAEIGSAGNLEVDSAGRLYFNRSCSPPCSRLGTYDPVAGGAVQAAPEELYQGVDGITRFTIRRRCYLSNEAVCLQGGRFRADVEYIAYDGASGAGQLAPARSRDTAIFWFFDSGNWELMAKVLDGCAINGHFWVYGAASTDVGYGLTVTDTQTGAQKTYSNPLGTLSPAITDAGAFACDP